MKKLIPVAILNNGEIIQGCESTVLNIYKNVHALECIFADCIHEIKIIKK